MSATVRINFALVVPMANEEQDFPKFIGELSRTLDKTESGTVYLVVDNVSTDNTLLLCRQLTEKDRRFHTVYAPENRNVVDAYIRGYREAWEKGHELIIEMDAGMSHDPKELPNFLKAYHNGYHCIYGSRFIKGGSIKNSNWKRHFLSRVGTILSNVLLNTNMYDTTSGYQGFHRDIVEKIINYPLLSKGHFYQTEIRFLLRKHKFVEIPIHYTAPSPRVSSNSIKNSLSVLLHYFFKRLSNRSIYIS